MKLIIPDNAKKEIKISESTDLNIGNNSEVKIIDISDSDVNVLMGENSRVLYVIIKKNNSESRKMAIVGKNSKISWIECCIGENVKGSVRTELNGEGSETETMSVIFGDKNNTFDMKNEVIHIASKSRSNMLTRVVLNDHAKAVYNGLVRVNPDAFGCEGYQKKETILLSDDARVEAVPNLEIENNDVKCSHGATISQIDDEKLFYLMSRGINENDSKIAIVEGFFDPILNSVDEELRDEIKKNISLRLGALNETIN